MKTINRIKKGKPTRRCGMEKNGETTTGNPKRKCGVCNTPCRGGKKRGASQGTSTYGGQRVKKKTRTIKKEM